MMVTLALTVVVPLTVDPELGDVMLTIRLPSCADAGGGDIAAQPSIADTTTVRASRLRSH
jgi:hypothetical protein